MSEERCGTCHSEDDERRRWVGHPNTGHWCDNDAFHDTPASEPTKAAIRKGREELARGEGVYLGSFAQYADEPTEDATTPSEIHLCPEHQTWTDQPDCPDAACGADGTVAYVKKAEAERMRDDAVREAWEEGVRNWAWWKDGVQYVGSCGMTLDAALAKNPYRATKGEG